MSKKFVFKKAYSNFHPALHWNIILLSSLCVFLMSVVYAGYLYIHTKAQINKPVDESLIINSIQHSTSSLPFDSLKSVKNIEQVVEMYKKRAETYTEIMYGLRMGEVPLIDLGNASVGTEVNASTSIATTTK